MAFPVESEDGSIVNITDKRFKDGVEVFTDEDGNQFVNSLLHPLKVKLLTEVEEIVTMIADKAIEQIEDVKEAISEMVEEEIGSEEEPEDPEAA